MSEPMIREERWVPIHESGERWAPRSREAAEKVMAETPVGFCYTDGAFAGGITRIVHEVRYVTEWRATTTGDDDE